MKETASRPSGRKRWIIVVIGVLLVGALVTAAYLRASGRVQWPRVLAAIAAERTVSGVGRLYGADGSEWAVALWVQITKPESFAANSLLVPVSGPKRPPSPEVVDLAQAVNFLDADRGVLRLLAREGLARRIRRTEFGGRPAWEVTVSAPAGARSGPDLAGFTWRFYLDPDTRLVRGLDLFRAKRLVAKMEYRYNQPLPKGFKPA